MHARCMLDAISCRADDVKHDVSRVGAAGIVSCQAPISLAWSWIPIDRGQTPHLFWQSLKPQPQVGETLQGGRQRGPPRAAAQCEIGTPPESTTQRAARRGPSLVECEHRPAFPTSGRRTVQPSTVLLGQWARKKWRASSPNHPSGRGSARTEEHSAANGLCECGVARTFLPLESARPGDRHRWVPRHRPVAAPRLAGARRDSPTGNHRVCRDGVGGGDRVVFSSTAPRPSGAAGVELPRAGAGGREPAVRLTPSRAGRLATHGSARLLRWQPHGRPQPLVPRPHTSDAAARLA